MKDDAASLVELSLEEKRALLAARLRKKARAPKHLPMSFAQQRLWFLDQMQPGSTLYNIPGLVMLRGPLDLGALRKVLNEIVRRHEVLRTTFAQVNEQPVQVVAPSAEVEIDLEDLRALTDEARRVAARRAYEAEGKRSFDLARGPLLHARLLWLKDEEQHLIFTMHHIISDGWSVGVLTKEVTLLYTAFAKGEPSPLPELSIQYADFAAWQLKRLSGEFLESHLDYWQRQLEGIPEWLELPSFAGPKAAEDAPGAELSLVLPEELSGGLKALSRRENATLFMTLLAAFDTLLHRYTGQSTVLVGSPIAGRDRAELEPLIGFFVNTLLMRADFDDDPTFRRLLARVKETALGAYAHQALPFEKLVEELRPERSLGGVPLVQVMFTLQTVSYGEEELGKSAAFGTEAKSIQAGTELPLSKFDLTLSAVDSKGGLYCSLQYRTDLFSEDAIRRMLENFKVLLQSIVNDPDRRVSKLPILAEAERRSLLVEWNETGRERPRGATLTEMFEAQAARTPDAVALVSGERQLSYGELSRQVKRLAGMLLRRGAGPEVLVGLFADPSPEMVVGMLAVLRVGGAYLPLDPSTPQRRLAALLDAARVPFVVTQQSLLTKLPERPQPHVLLDEQADEQGHADGHAAETRPARKHASAAAYVIHVSGPDGRPRGVVVEEAQVVNNLHALAELALFEPGTSCAALLPFDANSAQAIIFALLCTGATLHLVSGAEADDLAAVGRSLAARPVDALRLAPSQLSALLEEVGDESPPPILRWLILGGEPARAELVGELRGRLPGAVIINHYAPTEAAGGGLAYTFVDGRPSSPPPDAPVGRPLPNTKAYVLDRHLNPVPIGVAGELYLGGEAPARGYLGRSAETAEKFVPDPFGHGARLYRTGDLARRMPDGALILLGRVADRQVNIKGLRVEPEEVEALLRGHRGVREAFVTAQEDARRVKHLVAYVVASEGEDELDLHREVWETLRSSLPAGMLPSSVIFLDELPLAPDGSVDARLLPSPYAAMAGPEKEFAAPRNSTELRLLRIWEELLGVSPIGVTDNFFNLGGHSLLAVRMLARVRKQFGRQVPLPALFERATVEHLAEVVRHGAVEEVESPLVAVQPHGDRRPFFCVHEIGGGIIDYVHLARHLGAEQPFYGLQAPGHTESDLSVQAAAARYLEAVREAQPEGPYLLGGWSFGGLVAFEMARQLQARGDRVALLALFDSIAPGLVEKGAGADIPDPRDPAEVVKFIGQTLRGGFDVPLEDLQTLAPGQQLARVFELAREQLRIPPEIELEEFLAWLRGLRGRLLAERAYAPRPYGGSITLYKAADMSSQSQAARERLALDPTYGWGALAEGGVETHTVPGSHRTLVLEPHVSALAERLRQSLARVEAGAEA